LPAHLFKRWIKNLIEKTGPRAPRAPSSAARYPVRWRHSIECLEDRTTPVFVQTYNVFASSYFDGAVYEFSVGNQTTLQTLVAPNSQSVLEGPAGMVVGPDGNLYFSSQNNDSIVEFNTTTRELSPFIGSAVLDPIATANGDALFAPSGLAFGPDGNLYVSLNGGRAATSGGGVIRFGIHNTNGLLSYTGTNATVATGLIQPTGMTFGAGSDSGTLYVSDSGAGTVVRIAGATGAAPSTGTFITAGEGGLNSPTGLLWGPNGDLYVTDQGATTGQGQVLVYAPTGAFQQVFTRDQSLKNQFPSSSVFLPNGGLLTADLGPTLPMGLGGPGTSGSITTFRPNGSVWDVFSASNFPANPSTGVTNFSPSALALVVPPITFPPPSAGPPVSVSAPSNFDPQNPLSITVDSTNQGGRVQAIFVNWGDGTGQTFTNPAAVAVFTHQYTVSNSTYTVEVAAVDQPVALPPANQNGATPDIAFAGTQSTPAFVTVVAALPTAQQGVVAALYLDLLGRSADPSGLNSWGGMLASGAPVSQVINGLMASPEYQERVLNGLYEQYLGRPVDSVGIASWSRLLQSGGPEAVAAALAGSSEFFAHAGGTDTGFLQALYTDALGRQIDPSGLSNWTNRLASGVSPGQIATDVLTSPEAVQNAVEQAYQTYLGRPADQAGLQSWEQNYSKNPGAFLAEFLTTAAPEITQRVESDTTVVPPSPPVAQPAGTADATVNQPVFGPVTMLPPTPVPVTTTTPDRTAMTGSTSTA
jgi:sugar lactone lactonase YvrE